MKIQIELELFNEVLPNYIKYFLGKFLIFTCNLGILIDQ